MMIVELEIKECISTEQLEQLLKSIKGNYSIIKSITLKNIDEFEDSNNED